MENTIYIHGEIGSEVTLESVKRQYDSKSQTVLLDIDSYGGSVEEGLKIRDWANSLPQTVNTRGSGMVASIATMPFLIGEERTLTPNAQFLAHLPLIDNFSGNTDDFERATDYMQDITDKIAGIYGQYINLGKEQIIEFMRKDTPIFADKALQMGFATNVPKFKAVAKFNLNKMSDTKKEGLSKLEKTFNEFMNLWKDDDVKNIEVNNEELEVQNVTLSLEGGGAIFVVSEDGELEGKVAYMTDEEGNRTEELVPAGEYQLTDNRMIVIGEGGIVESVSEIPAEDANREEMENLKNQVQELTSKLENSEKLNSELQNKLDTEIKNQAEKINDMESMINNKMNEIKNMAIGGNTPLPKGSPKNTSKLNKEQTKGHKLDKTAAWLKKQ